MSERLNFRTSGRHIGRGRLRTGSVLTSGATDEKVLPSIPSKFETVLYKNKQEQDGFASRTHRFTSVAHENPGPGQYDVSGDVVLTKPSIGDKGYGVGFASKTKRFSTDYRRRPSPNKYNVSKPVEARKSFSRAPASGGYIPRVAIEVPKKSDPGPGHYNPDEGSHGPAQVDYAHSRGKRDTGLSSRSLVPGPGTYSPSLGSPTNAPSVAAFRSGTLRGVKRTNDVPGPGAYDPHVPEEAVPVYGPRLAFGSGQELDRGPETRSGPGPAAYDTRKAAAPAPVSQLDTPFASTTERWNYSRQRKDGPGPADYFKNGVAKRPVESFHFNKEGQWMTR